MKAFTPKSVSARGSAVASLSGLAGIAVVAGMTTWLAAGQAMAQPAPAKTAGPAPAAGPPVEGQEPAKVKVEKGAGGKTVYRITEAIRIEGKIQKPEAFYVLQKSSINYDWQDLKQDFVPKIVDSVTKAPF
jgi:hypothetical protein